MKRLRWPGGLNYRIFTAYLLLVIIPFSLLCLIGFQQIEQILKQQQVEQNKREMGSFREDLLDLTGLMTRSLILINQNPSLEQYLSSDSPHSPFTAMREINRNLDSLANSFFLSTPSVFLTVTDRAGHAYYNYTSRKPIDGEQVYNEIAAGLQEQRRPASYYWEVADSYVSKEIASGSKLLTIDSLLLDAGSEPYGAVRISMDHRQWLKQWTGAADPQAAYLVLGNGGEMIYRSKEDAQIPDELTRRFQEEFRLHPDKLADLTSEREQALYLASYMPSLEWTLIKKISLEQVFAGTNAIKRTALVSLVVLTLVFIAATLLISSNVTKPLHKLRDQMRRAADQELRVTIPTSGYRGEILQLLTSFNRMIADIGTLIYRLKVEERQKESVRFQILVSQMDPHFLLNTLNMIKSQALKNKDNTTFDICVSLGLLLETSLNTELDLIPLGQELGFMEAYMHIQNIRFGNRYHLDVEYDPSLYYALVPKFTLQPLVENAIIHGFADTVSGGQITVNIQASGKELIMLVMDNGAGPEVARQAAAMAAVRRSRKGIGLSNIRERLELLYRGQASLTLTRSGEEGRTIVEIRTPLLVSEPYAKGESDDV
ncbi:sensor histidine kinase [Paenibacillus sp. FSL H3-0333]|uniref:sensor histidine kinase n=1 Tax=Paenibacillus sp. FSL H3-0333 TaxID=2921373 RepID=UPI0030F6A315